MQNLTEKQQKDVTKLIIKAEKDGTSQVNKNGATVVYDFPIPFKAIDGSDRNVAEGELVTLWRSPANKDNGTCIVNIFKKVWTRKKSAPKATTEPAKAPVTPIEAPAVPKTKPTIVEEQKPAPVPAGASDTMDADSVNHIIQSAKANGARRVTVAVVTF